MPSPAQQGFHVQWLLLCETGAARSLALSCGWQRKHFALERRIMIAVFTSCVLEYVKSLWYMLLIKNSMAHRYQEFISDEVKRKWRWRRQHEGEFEFWKQVVYGVYGARCTLMSARQSVCLHKCTCRTPRKPLCMQSSICDMTWHSNTQMSMSMHGDFPLATKWPELLCCAWRAAIMMTFSWQVMTPHSFLPSLLPPLWVSWAMYDNMFINPIGFALFLMIPAKFFPGAYWRWI